MSRRYPESSVFYRRLDRSFLLAVRGEGSWLVDEKGKRYLDASGGAMVANLGHDVADVVQAVAAAGASLGYVNGTQFTHWAVEALADELAEVLPEPLAYSYFLASGSEAVEAAVKLARQYWCEVGRPDKWKVISRVPSYHGNTLLALSLSGREHYRKTFGPLLLDLPRIPAPDPYRDPDGPGSTGEALEDEIDRQGAETVAAFLAEPILGSSAGAVVPTEGSMRRIAEICRKHEILWIADEVLCGMGRTGRWLACEHFGVVPDVVVLGKGLNAGVVPLSAVVAGREIVAAIAKGSGAFNHAQTYSHSPAICAAGYATVQRLKSDRLVERAASLEPIFLGTLDALRRYPVVGDVRGKGLLAAIEFVADRETKEPFARTERFAERFTAQAFDQGLIVWPSVGHVDGERGDLIMLAPPLTVSLDELAELGRLLSVCLEELA
jgi:hypothetical protein